MADCYTKKDDLVAPPRHRAWATKLNVEVRPMIEGRHAARTQHREVGEPRMIG